MGSFAHALCTGSQCRRRRAPASETDPLARYFIAIPLPDEIGDRLLDLQSGLDGVRWTPFDNFHLTLRFIGDASPRSLEDVDDFLNEVAVPPFELELAGTGQFGKGPRRSVWVGVAANPLLRRLQSNVETACRRAGLAPETRKFTPHVTLGYLKGSSETQVAQWRTANNLFRSGPFPVEAFNLYVSHQSKSGNSYESIANYALSSSR